MFGSRSYWNPYVYPAARLYQYHPRRRCSTPQPTPAMDFYNYIPAHSVADYEEEEEEDEEEEAVQRSVPAPKCEVDRVTAAVRVQNAARGFLVRKNVKVVRGLEEEVVRMENEMARKESWNEKEKLRLSETLMGVLLRLDSVRGVRDYRKKVVRKVIQIQDALDL